MQGNRSVFFILITGVLLISLFVAGCTESSNQETPTSIAGPTEEPTEEATVPPNEETPVSTAKPTGEPSSQVQTNNLELEVLKTEKRESANGMLPYSEKIFVIVTFRITNDGDIPYEYNAGLVRLVDENNYYWPFVESVTFQSGVLDNPFSRRTIEPGDYAEGSLIFSVPQSTQTYPLLLLYDNEGDIVAQTVIGTVAEPTQAYDLELEFLKAGKSESANGFNPYQGKIFLLVSFKITNHGDIPYDYSPAYVWVEDENKNTWGFVEDATFQSGVLITPFGRRTIEPGTYAGGGLIFSVPQSTQTYRLLLYNDIGNMVAETEIGTVLG